MRLRVNAESTHLVTPRLAVPAAHNNSASAGFLCTFTSRADARMLRMPRRNLLFAQLGIVAILAVLHNLGFIYFLYWRFHWFDILTHLIAGIWAALFAAWILTLRQKMLTPVFCVGVALVIGVVWELFEAAMGVTQFPADILDTIKDLSVDIIGGISGVYLARLISRPLP